MKFALPAALFAALIAASANAATELDFEGSVENTCSFLSVNDGKLGLNANGRTLGSQEAGGQSGTVQVVTTGDNVVTFGKPSLPNSPASYNGNPDLFIKVGNGNYEKNKEQDETVGYPGTTYTVHAKAQSDAAFPAGNYTIRTVMTCAPAASGSKRDDD